MHVREFTYFGNSAGWFFPNLFTKHSQNKEYKTLVKKLIRGADKLLLKDGSIKDRITRGNRALWYHHSGLGEAFMIMEITKAAELFHDTYLDHSVIEPWAKKNIIRRLVMVSKILGVILTQLPRMLPGSISCNIDTQTIEPLSL